MTIPRIPLKYYKQIARQIYFFEGKPYWNSNGKYKPNRIGTLAGSVDHNGYRRIAIKIDGVLKNVNVQQLCWYMEYGTLPDKIDHFDDDKDNNIIGNLRDFNNSENIRARYRTKIAKSGFIGVYARRGRWFANITNGKRIHLGTFDTALEAATARDNYIIANNLAYCSKFNCRMNINIEKPEVLQSC